MPPSSPIHDIRRPNLKKFPALSALDGFGAQCEMAGEMGGGGIAVVAKLTVKPAEALEFEMLGHAAPSFAARNAKGRTGSF
jgi:hypothetical protein